MLLTLGSLATLTSYPRSFPPPSVPHQPHHPNGKEGVPRRLGLDWAHLKQHVVIAFGELPIGLQ